MENIENAAAVTETAADQQDAFLDGFDADEAPVTEAAADQQEEQVEVILKEKYISKHTTPIFMH